MRCREAITADTLGAWFSRVRLQPRSPARNDSCPPLVKVCGYRVEDPFFLQSPVVPERCAFVRLAFSPAQQSLARTPSRSVPLGADEAASIATKLNQLNPPFIVETYFEHVCSSTRTLVEKVGRLAAGAASPHTSAARAVPARVRVCSHTCQAGQQVGAC
jgi:hypothetical protein